ncbi:MAG: ester cyclase [Flavisolibacter sp.]
MKKILIFAGIFSLCSCNSSNNSSSSSSESQKNLDASRVINNAFLTGDTSKIDNVVAADFVDHSDHGDVPGRDSLKKMIVTMHTQFKDMKMEVMHDAADSSQVFTQIHYTGTGDGVMMPPGAFDMHGIEVTRFKDGKAVEHWGYGEMGEMMKMMTRMQQPMNTQDTTKKKNM